MEEWLRSIGLGERVETFRAQRITFDILPDLTDGELAELGL
ncbi:MAG: SAM domain-containing protein, partial [Acetobacteraceae bacterium]